MTPCKVHLETPRFVLRTVEPDDVTQRWASWLADPAKTRMLNAKPMTLSVDNIRAYVASFDHIKAHILGVFEKASGEMVGFWEVYVDWSYREFLINVLIGERGRSAIGAREETQQVLHAHFFAEMGLEAMRCSVLSANALVRRVLLEKGAVHEHTSRKAAAGGGTTVEILHFRLTRDAWAAARARRLAREQAAALDDGLNVALWVKQRQGPMSTNRG